MVDWETLERQVLYRGKIGTITEEANQFTADLASRKTELSIDAVPRTSPGCRAMFCGPGCGLNAVGHTYDAVVAGVIAADRCATKANALASRVARASG